MHSSKESFMKTFDKIYLNNFKLALTDEDQIIFDFLYNLRKKQEKIRVSMTRHEMDKKDALPFLKKDAKCILFLTVWAETGVADPWFGVQSYNSHMANRIKELSKQKKTDRTTKPSTATE